MKVLLLVSLFCLQQNFYKFVSIVRSKNGHTSLLCSVIFYKAYKLHAVKTPLESSGDPLKHFYLLSTLFIWLDGPVLIFSDK